VALAGQLRGAGYRITLAGPGGEYDNIDGFEYRRVELKLGKPSGDPSGIYTKFGKAGRLLWQHRNRRARRAEALRLCDAEQLITLAADRDPDLFLIDVEEHRYILAALSLDIPVALFSVFFNLWKRPGIPPLHSAVIPGKNLSGKAILVDLLWLRFRFWKRFYRFRDFLFQGGLDQCTLFGCYAEHLGLRLKDHVDFNQWLIPFVYKQLPTLVLNAKEFDFPLAEPEETVYVGPLLCLDRSRLPFLPATGESSAKLDTLLNRYRQGQPDRCLVFCSFGSFFRGDDIKFLQKLAACFLGTDWDVIISLGDRLAPEQLGSLPGNVCCVRYANQMEILSVADCAVIHGGMTTAYECIAFGVPMVVYPFNVNDQSGTAARIEYHHLGLIGDRKSDNSLSLRKRIKQAMEDQQIRNNILLMQQHMKRYTDSRLAAQAVERILEKDPKEDSRM